MKRVVLTIALILAFATVAYAQHAARWSVWALGNEGQLNLRAGLAWPTTEWGIDVLHFPNDDGGTQAIGLYGVYQVPDLISLPVRDWTGISWLPEELKAVPFVGVAVDLALDDYKGLVLPEAGLKIEPTKNMTLIVRWTYKVGDKAVEPKIDLNNLVFNAGLEVAIP